ncbi:MAG TPA: chemotaxis protein CheW [Solirubrobacteraceae bacterium]|nr:chemotaxis protein CheW [Solirubrobacteraceae bacterium]
MSEPPAREEPTGPAAESPESPRPAAPARARRAKAPAHKAPDKKPARTRRAPARKPAAKARGGPVQAVVFVLGGDEYALPIGQVQEVINYTEPRSISSDVSWVRGVINLRGSTLPICDLAARLGLARGSGSGRIVVVQSDEGPAGLTVDDVREVLTRVPDQLEELTVTNDPAITAIAKLGERLVVLVDAPAALAGAKLGRRA